MVEGEVSKMIFRCAGNSNIFVFPLQFNSRDDIHCYLKEPGQDEKVLTNGVDFRVENKTDYTTGAIITLQKIPAAGSILAIMREIDIKQLLSLPQYGKLNSEAIEKTFDKIIMICQQLREGIKQCIGVENTEELSPAEVLKLLFKAQETAAGEADRAERAASQALTNGESQVQRAKYWAEQAKDAVVSGDITYEELGTGAIITPDVSFTEDQIEYDEVQ